MALRWERIGRKGKVKEHPTNCREGMGNGRVTSIGQGKLGTINDCIISRHIIASYCNRHLLKIYAEMILYDEQGKYRYEDP